MTMTEYRLVYDSGSKVLKCAIADEFGKIISLETWEEAVIKKESGLYREWNHKTYWESLIDLTKITLKAANIDPNQTIFAVNFKDFREDQEVGLYIAVDTEKEAKILIHNFDKLDL